MRNVFDQGDDVLSPAPFVYKAIHYLFHQMQPEPADLTVFEWIFQLRCLFCCRIKGDAVVFDANADFTVFMGKRDGDIVKVVVCESVLDDIGKQFIHGQIDLKDTFFRQSDTRSERLKFLAQSFEFGDPVFEFDRYVFPWHCICRSGPCTSHPPIRVGIAQHAGQLCHTISIMFALITQD